MKLDRTKIEDGNPKVLDVKTSSHSLLVAGIGREEFVHSHYVTSGLSHPTHCPLSKSIDKQSTRRVS